MAICLALGLIITCLLSSYGVVGPDAMPFGDGQRYAIRAFTLYGYLHSGQWSQFWNLFTLNKTSVLAPLHYWFFFLLPQGWAGSTAYGAILGLTNYLVLAFGTWAMCQALDRKEWAPLLFLLLASQNISLDFTYYYFCDVPFFALGTVAFAAQLRAWQKNNISASILSGVLAALLFLVKPANAAIFAITYALAEAVHVGINAWQAHKGRSNGILSGQGFRQHLVGIALGFFSILFLAVSFGAMQTIMRLIDANEISNLFPIHLDCTGVMRLLYFPLCLTYFYNATLMLVVVIIIASFTLFLCYRRRGHRLVEKLQAFPLDRLLPLLVAYLILGEYYSFGMDTKTMRSLLLVLPSLWLLVFWMVERFRVRLAIFSLGILFYVLCAYSQVFFQSFPCKVTYAENYQLTDDWLTRFPPPIYVNKGGVICTRGLLNYVHYAVPTGGNIAVGSDQIYWNSDSLDWFENSGLLLQGKTPIYNFNTFLRSDGCYERQALIGAKGMLLYTDPSVRYSNAVYRVTQYLVLYGEKQWSDRDHVISILPLVAKTQNGYNEIMGYVFVFKQPMSEQQIAAAISATHSPGYAVNQEQFSALHDRRLTWLDCRDILFRWVRKHFDFSSNLSPSP